MLPSSSSGGLPVDRRQSSMSPLRPSTPSTSSGLQSEFLQRMFTPAQISWDYASSQMVLCMLQPSKVYKMNQWRKQTKNQWARDDPGFLLILLALTFVSSLAYAVAFHAYVPVYGFIKVALHGAFQVLGVGAAIASLGWYVANSYLRVRSGHTVEQKVEWLYCFDIHCNGFISLFALLHVAQFFALPLLLRDGFAAAIAANLLYGVAGGAYVYVTFIGYTSMPFLKNTQLFIYPGYALILLLVFLTLFDYNAAILTMRFYFG